MELAEFDYHLPHELIAQRPKTKRDTSQLMVLFRDCERIEHCRHFYDIVNYLNPGDILVLNNTRVIPARLIGRRITGAKVEMLITDFHGTTATAMIKTRKRPTIGEKYYFEPYWITVLERMAKEWLIDFSPHQAIDIVEKKGYPPLPPYIKKKVELTIEDQEQYQTIYACHSGAIAAPTAGLHFTSELLDNLKQQGVTLVYITLHVGIGTFLPVRVKEIEQHKMHGEYYSITPEAAKTINKGIAEGKRIIAVGTTSCRTLEGNQNEGIITWGQGQTDIYIYPGFSFTIVGGLLSNFHLPKSTPLLLVSAFAGKDFILDAYKQAIAHNYRFYSYGDAMLIL